MSAGCILSPGCRDIFTPEDSNSYILGTPNIDPNVYQDGNDDNVVPLPATNDDSQQSKKDQCIERCSDSTLPTIDNVFSFWNCVNKCMEEEECE